MRSREGEVKLADFGIAKATEQSSITQVGSVLGTAAYLAPEQARGEEAGPPADLYALGVVTYQLISGRLPYEATSLTELALKQQREAPPMLDALVAAVTPELADAVAIALALDPRDRYQNAHEMGRALLDGMGGIAPAKRQLAGEETASSQATRVLAGDRASRAATRTGAAARASVVTPRQPRPAAAARRSAAAVAPAAIAAPAPSSASAPRRRGSRLALALLALLGLAAVIVAVVILTAPAPTRVTLRNVVYSDVHETSQALKQLVSENTK